MNKNQIEGTIKNATGKLQQKVGEVTGNSNQQAKGVAKQVEGTLQKGVGNVQKSAKDSDKTAAIKR
jgi:uncharacterized protein YjbJ (UPF0337 family)